MELSPGTSNSDETHTMLCGRFELMREEPANTGVQLFGPTLAVLDTQSGEPARACVLDAALLPTPEARAAFVRELGELGELQDSSLVPQVFVGQDGDRVVVCYDPLQGAFALRDMDDGPRSSDLANELQRLARQLARALATLHARDRVHGMLAGEAVFVGPRGPAAFQHGFAPLCARAELERRWSTVDQSLLAPEVLAGGGFTPLSDTYAWGVALMEFATGLRGAAALRAAEPPGLQAGLWALIGASLSADPSARPQGGAELVRRLESLALAGTAEAAPEPIIDLTPATPPPPPPRPNTKPPVSNSAPLPLAPPPVAVPPVLETLSVPTGPSAPGVSVREPPKVTASAPVEQPVMGLEDLLFGEGSIRPNSVAALRSSSIPSGTFAAVSAGGFANPQDPSGRSNSGLRRVHVLTEDSIVRRGSPSRPDIVIEPSVSESIPAASRSDVREREEKKVEAPAAAAPAPEPPVTPLVSLPSPAAESRPPVPKPPELPAPKRTDSGFWLVIAALLLAVVLAWAFT
ncbi:protein kinase [Nannocystis sp. SCPEA4]|uniref:protein kinase n=1 Tax=Nannocystis sp. SCPEA4 TaxID=2996787 RepID=UPI00226D6B89|nr:protein kinase [Nannocystis sp. SCPEA4]MCY1053744.1 protein kinase [Nannocystis sp. SCPEA4]